MPKNTRSPCSWAAATANPGQAARLGAQWGYDEINLNCGCPSDRVQRGAFGASLMKAPQLVADCVKAMRDVVDMPVTVKHRIGIDKEESYSFVRDFVGTVADAGCTVFIDARAQCLAAGPEPEGKPRHSALRYEVVRQLKADFPQFTFAINGGFTTDEAVQEQLQHLDGVMVGREAYHNPGGWPAGTRSTTANKVVCPAPLTREEVELAMVEYMEREAAQYGTPWAHIARHMLGLRHSLAGARIWRQVWSNHLLKDRPARGCITWHSRPWPSRWPIIRNTGAASAGRQEPYPPTTPTRKRLGL